MSDPSINGIKPELLSPAGNWDCAKAAVQNGADAIYFGLDKFNARLRADNFTLGMLPELMEFLHSYGVRGYVTMNTLIFTSEIADAMHYLSKLNQAGVDGVIIQDVGLAKLMTEWQKDHADRPLELHASTQMTISSPEGLNFFESFLNIRQAVLSRELSLTEIEECAKHSDIPLEVFVHGALCVSYSGQCLTSESLGRRSANRGECAQACRLPFRLIKDGKLLPLGEQRYLLSPQDLCAIDQVPELVRVGVKSYKIEGRLKSPEYVAAVTSAYRKALDAAAQNIAVDELVTPKDRYALQMVFSRGFSSGWLEGTDHPKLTHARHGKKRGFFVGTITHAGEGWVDVDLEGNIPLAPGDGFVIDAGQDRNQEQGGRIWKIQRNRLFFHGKASNIDWKNVKTGQKLWKTDDPALNQELQKATRLTKTVSQSLELIAKGKIGEPLLVECPAFNITVKSDILLDTAQSQPLTQATLERQLGRLGGTNWSLKSCQWWGDKQAILPVSAINKLRRELVELLDKANQPQATKSFKDVTFTLPTLTEKRDTPKHQQLSVLCRQLSQIEPAIRSGANLIYLDFEDIRHYTRGVNLAKEINPQIPVILATPRIQKPSEVGMFKSIEKAGADGILIRNPGAADYFKDKLIKKVGDFSLNVANPYSAEAFLKFANCDYVTISYDLNASQVSDLLEMAPASWFELTIHQHMPMFHMEHCVFCTFLSEGGHSYKDCGRPCERHLVELEDRVGQFHPLMADVGCRNTVFNGIAQTGASYHEQFSSQGLKRYRVELLRESAEETQALVQSYRRLLDGTLSPRQLVHHLGVAEQLGTTQGTLRPR